MTSVTSLHVEAASTLAVIASSNEPLLFLAADLTVIAASASFCRAFQIDPASVPGRPLSDLGAGEWALPQLSSLLRATASGSAEIEAYEIDLVRKGQATRSLVLNARKLEDGDKERVRLLLAITDVTLARAEARQKDDLIREKAILLQEVQHRVANSLQIIASVLMQSARKVQSEEARGHLRNAHHRVMSIAAVQRHLAASTLGDVALRPYFIQLCESLGASMMGLSRDRGGSSRLRQLWAWRGDWIEHTTEPGAEHAVVDRAADLKKQIGASPRPSHLLRFIHSPVDQEIRGTFGN